MERVGTILNISLQLVANLGYRFRTIPSVQFGTLTPDAEHG
ncbi:hypothetical protein NXY01_03180 [Bacteroides fragilis]|nr:hypothetical protein NXY01_03180 [Bacteroides fragilis]